MSSSSSSWSLYPYDPNKAAPIAFAVLMSILGGIQFYLCFFHFHWKKFGFTMVWATSVWVAGFICRSISVCNVQNVGIYIAQFVLILLGPPLYAAAEYFILGRLLAYVPYHTPIHPGRVFSTFAILSAAVESMTGAGAGNSAAAGADESARTIGLNLLKAALLLQCCVEILFFSMVVLVEYRCRRAKVFPWRVRIVCYVLYVTSLMMLLRCIIRAVEGFQESECNEAQGLHCGTVYHNEWFLWVFEVANITLFVIVLCIFHPGRYLPRSSNIFLDPIDGKTERLGPGFSKADKRPLMVTIMDPFDVYRIVTGKGMTVDKFWERHQPIYRDRVDETHRNRHASTNHFKSSAADETGPRKV